MSDNVMTKSQSKMGTARMGTLLITMALPSMFSMLVQALYNIVDSMFVSWISQDALTALSLANPIQLLLSSVAVGTGIGINSLLSRSLGAKREKDASSAALHGIILAIISWFVFVIIGLVFSRTFFELYSKDKEIIEMGTSYLSCCLIFSIGLLMQVTIEKILQATGNMIYPMIIQLIGAVINIILDPIFIFGFGIIPKMGVLGAAIATVLGQIIGGVFAVYILFFKKHTIKLSYKDFKFSLQTVKKIYQVGFPSIIMQSISCITMLFINGILYSISNIYVTAYGVYFKLQSFVFMPTFGINHSVLPIVGYNFGAKNKKRIYSAMKWGMGYAIIIMTLGLAAFWLFTPELMQIFKATSNLLNVGIYALRIISLGFIPAAFSVIFTCLFQAIGKGVNSLMISLIRQFFALIPIAYLFLYTSKENIWYAFPIAETIGLIFAIIIFIDTNKKIISKI